MNGCILKGTPIVFDFWKIRECPTATVFFLSHTHADHTAGLTKSWKNKIYCSEVTSKLVQYQCNVDEEWLYPLPLNEPKLIFLDDEEDETITVTLIDANHCPGAVMFLVEGYFGRVFYTGDFRYHEAIFDETVLPIIFEKPIDELYLDNTYCDPACNFMARDEACGKIIDIIKENHDKNVYIAGNNLGKEDLVVNIAKEVDRWISVDEKKYQLMQILEMPDVFTTDEPFNCIKLVPKWKISRQQVDQWTSEHPCVIIIPSALYKGLEDKPFINCPNVYIIPYSDHSCYSELQQFVKRIRPRKVIPIVNFKKNIFGQDCSNRADMSCFNEYLDKSEATPTKIPESVTDLMKRRRSLRPIHKTLRKRGRAKERPKPKKAAGVVYDENIKMDVVPNPVLPERGVEQNERVDQNEDPVSEADDNENGVEAVLKCVHLCSAPMNRDFLDNVCSFDKEWFDINECLGHFREIIRNYEPKSSCHSSPDTS